MIDKKWLRYQAMKLSKRDGIGIDEAFERVNNDPELGKAEELIECTECGIQVKGKKLAAHMKKHHKGPKIRWGRISIIQEQRARRKRLKKLVDRPNIKIVSGGLPGLGKKK